MQLPSPRLLRRSRRAGALVATAALAAMAAIPAVAAPAMAAATGHAASGRSAARDTNGPAARRPAIAHAHVRRPLPASKVAEVQASDAASAQARRLGRNVTVSALTSPTSLTVAHPNGTFTTTMYALPVRTLAGGHWVTISADLYRSRAGWTPRAVPSGLTFSSGGTGPLARMTSAQGSVALTFPARLPAPRISGATATYRNVLPGVNLALTATTTGGLTITWAITSARAAASPALRHLHLSLVTTGKLTAATDRAGNVAATSRGLGAVFSGPPATSWDSPAAARHAATNVLTGKGAELHPALRGTTWHLNPDPALLTARSYYPAYISQSLAPDFPAVAAAHGTAAHSPAATGHAFVDKVTMNESHFLETQAGCSGSKNYDIEQGSGSLAGNGVGYNWWSSCIGVYRSYYSFDTSASNSNWQIISATMTLNQTYSADGTCADTWPITAYSIGNGTTFGSGSDWANYQPTMNGNNEEMNSSGNYAADNVKVGEPSCADHTATFQVSDFMQNAASANANYWTWGFRGDESTTNGGPPTNCSTQNCGLTRYADNPKIVTTYDEYPNPPSGMSASPTPLDNPFSSADQGCSVNGGVGGWIGKTTLQNGGNTVGLKATFSGALTDEDVQGAFDFYSTEPTSLNTYTNPTQSGFPQGPDTITLDVGTSLLDGASYQWDAYAAVEGDNQDQGAEFITGSTDICGFRVDETAPEQPTVTSSVFPPLGTVTEPGTIPSAPATSAFSFTSYDPVPTAGACSSGGCEASGVYDFEYELNNPISENLVKPTAASSCPSGGVGNDVLYSVAATNGGGTASNPATATSCAIDVTNWGTNTLYVAAVDNAGNISQTYQYQFYVPWSGNAPTQGDVNGDGYPDLLATTSNGDLVLYPGHTDPNATPEIASIPADSPQQGTGWNNYQITHRGSFSQGSVDDLFALRGANLYRDYNNGGTPEFENGANLHLVNWPSCPQPLMESDPDNPGNCSGFPSGWSQISQVVAPGDAWTGANTYNSGTYGTTGITQDDRDPSLLAISKSGGLWLFQGNGAGQLENPIQLGSSGWNNMTVVAPGTVNGTSVLWARDNTTGTLYSYPFVLSANEVPTLDPANPASPIPAEGTGTTGAAITGAPTLTKAAYPTLTAALPLAAGKDATTGITGCASGNPGYYCAGLFAEDTSGNIWYYAGQPVSGSGGPLGSSGQLYVSTLSPSGYWPLGDNTGGACSATAADATGNGNTGTLNGSVSCITDPAAPSSEPNQPMVDNFDGSTGDITTAGPVVPTGAGDSFSVSAWVYLTAGSSNATAIGQVTSASDPGGATNSPFKLMYRANSNDEWALSMPATNSDNASVISALSPSAAPLNTWTQLTGTYNASSGLMTLYVNGQQAGTATDTTPFAGTGPMTIGSDLYNGSATDFFPGDIKDAQVYDYALSAAQAESLYQAPAASLPLDGAVSGVIPDSTGNGYSATTGGTVTYPVDKYFGAVADFDGSTGYAATSEPVLNTAGSFTVSAWAYLTSLPTRNTTIVSQAGTTNSSFYLQYNYAADGAPRWAFNMAQADSGTAMYNTISSSAAQDDTWTQLTGVYNASTGIAQLYVNGQLATTTNSVTLWGATGPLNIGRALYGGNYSDYFPGEVSDVQAFSYALSPGAVQALYQGQNPINQIS